MIKNFFPKYCVCCNKEVNTYLCNKCLNKLQNTLPQCPICNTLSSCGLTHTKCATNNIDQLITLYKYNKQTHKIMRYIKYKGCNSIIDIVINNRLKILEKISSNSVVIPIPMFNQKRRDRGYNVAEEIAKRVSLYTEMKVLKNNLYKIKQTKSQSTIKKNKRKLNVRNSFIWKPSKEYFNRILLVDDVITTKSTIQEVIKTINKANPNTEITIFALFSALKYH